MTPDQINGAIELCGAYFTWKNFAAYVRERELAGVYWPATAFFTLWGFWNLYYYPAIGQPLSLLGGIVLVGGNVMWLAYVLWDKLMRWTDVSIDHLFQAQQDVDELFRGSEGNWPLVSSCKACETHGYDHRGPCDNEGSKPL